MLSGFFKRLLMARQLNFTEGDVSIFDIQHVMHPANYHSHLSAELESRMGAKGREAVYAVGKRSAEEVAQTFSDKFKVSGIESINLWQNVIELSGNAKIVSVSPKEGGNVIVQANSAVSREALKRSGKVKDAHVDSYLAGFLAGVFSKIYSKEIVCVETKCLAAGDTVCEFVLKPAK